MVTKKEPWGYPGSPWKNSVAFYTYLRGCLRSAWSRNPIKHNLIKKQRRQIPNPNKNGKKATVWGADCAMCDGEFPISQIQVDHINPAGSLQCKEDIPGFVERLLFVTEDDLRLVCKGCNSALAYADKHGIPYEEALLLKQVIQMEKDKTLKKFLDDHGVTCKATQRREKALEILRKEEV